MCLGIPMQITAIHGSNAECSAKGIERDVSLFLLQDENVRVGDFVMVHVGYAIQKIEEQDARSAWEMVDAIHALESGKAEGDTETI
jgi:hydrogenase expression/formation protein HypC